MFFEEREDRVLLWVRISPNSKEAKIGGVFCGADGRKYLKISVVSVPEKGRANKELTAFLAKALHVAKSNVRLLSGETDRYKKFEIFGNVNMVVNYLKEMTE